MEGAARAARLSRWARGEQASVTGHPRVGDRCHTRAVPGITPQPMAGVFLPSSSCGQAHQGSPAPSAGELSNPRRTG